MTSPASARFAWPTAAKLSALDIQGEYLDPGPALPRDQGSQPPRRASARHVGALPHRPREGPDEPRPRMRLGHQAPTHRGIPGEERRFPSPTPRSRCSTSSTTTSTANGASTTACKIAALSSASATTTKSTSPSTPHPRPPEPSFAANSSRRPRRSGATTPSTGCTSSSTTTRSAPSLQGPVQVQGRTGGEAHRVTVMMASRGGADAPCRSAWRLLAGAPDGAVLMADTMASRGGAGAPCHSAWRLLAGAPDGAVTMPSRGGADAPCHSAWRLLAGAPDGAVTMASRRRR